MEPNMLTDDDLATLVAVVFVIVGGLLTLIGSVAVFGFWLTVLWLGALLFTIGRRYIKRISN